MNKKYAELDFPAWFDGKDVNEAAFCREFLSKNKLIYADNAFFTPDGRLTDPLLLKEKIYAELECCAAKNIPRTISNIVEIMKLAAHAESFPPKPDEIHVQNGTLRIDGSFLAGRPEIVRSRFPVAYNPQAEKPVVWLRFLSDLLYPEDIPTFQEYIGYRLVPSTKGQRMMILKGEGGEGKSQIGPVLARLFGCNMKDGCIAKISDNRFARADLEHIHLLVDDDMKMEALKQTNYVKSIVTAQGKMDLERKSVQSYQGWMYARLLAFSNGDLQSLYDRSNGFYRRQLILTTKEEPVNRVDDPDIAEKIRRPHTGKAGALGEGTHDDQIVVLIHQCNGGVLRRKVVAISLIGYHAGTDFPGLIKDHPHSIQRNTLSCRIIGVVQIHQRHRIVNGSHDTLRHQLEILFLLEIHRPIVEAVAACAEDIVGKLRAYTHHRRAGTSKNRIDTGDSVHAAVVQIEHIIGQRRILLPTTDNGILQLKAMGIGSYIMDVRLSQSLCHLFRTAVRTASVTAVQQELFFCFLGIADLLDLRHAGTKLQLHAYTSSSRDAFMLFFLIELRMR